VKFLISIVVSLFLMLCLASLLESWDEPIAVAAFVLFLVSFILFVSIQWARVSRANAKEGEREQPDRKQVAPFVVPASRVKEAEVEGAPSEREQTDLDKFMGQAAAGKYPVFNAIVTRITLVPGEQCCAVARNVEQIVPKAKTSNLEDCQGVSFRITKGVRNDVSAYKGRVVSTEGDTGSDRGPVYVTNIRVVFAGTVTISTVKLEEINDVRVYSDGVAIYQLNQQDPFIFRFSYGSSVLAAAIRAMVDQTRRPLGNQLNRQFPR